MRKFRIALLFFAAFDFFFGGTVGGFLALTPLAAAQNKPQYPYVSGAPDCILVPPGPFTAVADSAYYDNRNQGCTTWHLVYNSQGFSALNISFKSADDSGNGPGAFTNWGTSGGTLPTGTTLPLTAITSGQATGYKYRPFIKISVTSVTGTGTIWPMLYGYRPGNGDSNGTSALTANVQGVVASGSSATGVNPVVVAGVNGANAVQMAVGIGGELSIGRGAVFSTGQPTSTIKGPNANDSALAVFPYAYNGTSADPNFYCPTTVKLNALGAATTQIVAGASGKKIRVCSLTISNNNAVATTLKAVEGTGASCGTGTADVTALMNIGASSTTPIFLALGGNSSWTTNTAADALCFTSSAASSLEITISYAQW